MFKVALGLGKFCCGKEGNDCHYFKSQHLSPHETLDSGQVTSIFNDKLTLYTK